MIDYEWIVNRSSLPWLQLALEFDYQAILAEAIAIKHLFVAHRDQDQGAYRHKGWRSICLHGVSSDKTNHFTQYGYKSNDETPYIWTEIADLCPITTKFFKEIFPFNIYYRVRFMLLDPQGYITPHTDSDQHKLSPINIALNNPIGCNFKMQGHEGYVPFEPGSAFILDVGNTHAVLNNSDEDRYHMIVHGKPNEKFKKLIEASYAKNGIK
jgi:hypothetical protein